MKAAITKHGEIVSARTRKQQTGTAGETMAATYLQQKGYSILARNWHCSHGEIDLIARDGTVLVFVEVRTRRSANTETAFASIQPAKRKRLIASAQHYLQFHQMEHAMWRIDVIAVALPFRQSPIIDHAEDALGW